MSTSRLTAALEAGAVDLPPEGAIALYRPPIGQDVSALPKERLRIVHGFAPAHFYWSGLWISTTVEPPAEAAGALVFLPRAKALARDLLDKALSHGGPVILDGQKTDGIDALLRELKSQEVTLSAPFAKAHGKCVTLFGAPDALAAWARPDLMETASGWVTAPGLFSADGPDPGSVALAAALPARLDGRVADLGAGWGFLAAEILARPGVTECALVEAEAAGIAAARANVTDPRARFHWADATTWGDAAPFDHVVSNPPFHTGRTADPALGAAFIAQAARLLAPRGTFWLVANRHLPYEAPLAAAFGERTVLAEGGGYKIVAARAPLGPERRSARDRTRR